MHNVVDTATIFHYSFILVKHDALTEFYNSNKREKYLDICNTLIKDLQLFNQKESDYLMYEDQLSNSMHTESEKDILWKTNYRKITLDEELNNLKKMKRKLTLRIASQSDRDYVLNRWIRRSFIFTYGSDWMFSPKIRFTDAFMNHFSDLELDFDINVTGDTIKCKTFEYGEIIFKNNNSYFLSIDNVEKLYARCRKLSRNIKDKYQFQLKKFTEVLSAARKNEGEKLIILYHYY